MVDLGEFFGELLSDFWSTIFIFDDFDAKFGLFHPLEPYINTENPRNMFWYRQIKLIYSYK